MLNCLVFINLTFSCSTINNFCCDSCSKADISMQNKLATVSEITIPFVQEHDHARKLRTEIINQK